jgi:hypothetical protein
MSLVYLSTRLCARKRGFLRQRLRVIKAPASGSRLRGPTALPHAGVAHSSGTSSAAMVAAQGIALSTETVTLVLSRRPGRAATLNLVRPYFGLYHPGPHALLSVAAGL